MIMQTPHSAASVLLIRFETEFSSMQATPTPAASFSEDKSSQPVVSGFSLAGTVLVKLVLMSS